MLDALDIAIQADPLLWAHCRGLRTKSGLPYDLAGHRYQIGLLQTEKRVTNIKKGTQIGITLIKQIDAIHGLIHKRYPQGVMYMMPYDKVVERFSKLRFTPMFEENRWLKRYLSVNNVHEKLINGGSLIFVGAQGVNVGGSSIKDSAAARTFECDYITRDEIDLHDMAIVEESKQRLNYSLIRGECNLGSPTYPDYGIDAMYEQSDQGLFQIKCESCGKHTCMETTFPDCMARKDGVWFRSCIHCANPIFPANGEWDAVWPDREEAGRWPSSFLSPRADLDGYMKRYHNSDGNKLCEFMRSILGTASIEAEHQLSEPLVLSRCTKNANQMVSSHETCMGVDIGKQIHAVVGTRVSREAYDILRVAQVNDLTELHDLAMKMNVRTAVIDSGPYDHGVREFQWTELYIIYLCQYSEQMPGKPKFDPKSGIVKCNRNEWCDKVHLVFTENKITIPRASGSTSEFARQMTKTAKTILENPDTGLKKPKYIKLGDDHYYHGVLYFLLAASRTSPRSRGKDVRRPSHSLNTWK